MSFTKRRLAFATPFVVTALLAPACSHPAPQHPQPPDSPDANVADGPAAAPVADGAWSKVGEHWVYTYKDPHIASIMMYPNGVCEFDPQSACARDDDSVTVTHCNPPPPESVQCPPGAPDPGDQGH